MDHIVFVTGAGSGIGMATARRFAAEGARVIAADMNENAITGLAAELGGRIHPLCLNVTDRTAVAAAAALPEAFAAVTVLVNAAGLARGLGPAHEANLDDWDLMVDVNVKGVMYVTRAILPGMVARNRGHVVNIGSVAADYPYPGGHVYGATKAFVRQFTLNLREDLLGTAVRATCIEPGMTRTQFNIVRFRDDPGRADAIHRGIHCMTPDELAGVIHTVTTLPDHMNVNVMEVVPVQQAGAYRFHRMDETEGGRP